MFLKHLSRATRTISVRLNLWYAGVFMLSSALAFFLLYFLLSRAVENKDREVIETRLREYGLRYDQGGTLALDAYVSRSRERRQEKSFFVRLVSRFGEDKLLFVPPEWVSFDPKSLQSGGFP